MSSLPTQANANGRVLVLGAAGQVGAQLCAQLGARALPASRRPPANATTAWLTLDLEHIAATPDLLDGLLEKHNVTAVICSAGATDVERCEADRGWAEAANYTGPAALAQAARSVPFVFFSTDYVFDGQDGPYAEDDATAPLSIYGNTKLAGERAVLEAHPGALVLRTTTVYGPDAQGKNFLYTLRRLLSDGKTMRVPHDQLSTPTYNQDLAAATLALIDADEHGIFHVAGPEFLSRYDFALQACALLDLPTATLHSVSTAELNQKAARPLLGGLRIDRLQQRYPALTMQTAEEGIRHWAAAHAAPVARA